jgi:hypothetical protein
MRVLWQGQVGGVGVLRTRIVVRGGFAYHPVLITEVEFQDALLESAWAPATQEDRVLILERCIVELTEIADDPAGLYAFSHPEPLSDEALAAHAPSGLWPLLYPSRAGVSIGANGLPVRRPNPEFVARLRQAMLDTNTRVWLEAAGSWERVCRIMGARGVEITHPWPFDVETNDAETGGTDEDHDQR